MIKVYCIINIPIKLLLLYNYMRQSVGEKDMKTIYFYFDDSGVLHRNAPNRFFVYAGLVFLDSSDKDSAKRKYCNVNKKIKKSLGVSGELKACHLERKHKNSLYRTIKDIESAGLTVEIKRVNSNILDHKKSIHRYKDYVLKMLIKEKLKELINRDLINSKEDVRIMIYVDEQATATNGYYNLKESVYEELKNGVQNFNYGIFYPPIFKGRVTVSVQYCDSKNHYLIQASDILANRIWTSFMVSNEELRNIPNHRCLRLP